MTVAIDVSNQISCLLSNLSKRDILVEVPKSTIMRINFYNYIKSFYYSIKSNSRKSFAFYVILVLQTGLETLKFEQHLYCTIQNNNPHNFKSSIDKENPISIHRNCKKVRYKRNINCIWIFA